MKRGHWPEAAAIALIASGCGSSERAPAVLGDAGGDGLPRENSCLDPAASCEAFGDARPTRLSEHAAAYAPERRELLVFGGTLAVPQGCEFPAPDYVGDVYIYNEACGAWRRAGGSGPSPRARAIAAWGGERFWIFGGRFRESGSSSGAYRMFAELWSLDPDEDAWQMHATGEAIPTPRADGALVWDSNRELLWLFGGNESSDGLVYAPLADLWSFDPAASRWEQHLIAGDGPPARLQHSMLFDAARDRLVVYGGADASAFSGGARYSRDLWALDIASMSWSVLHDGEGNAPVGRFWTSITNDPERGVYLVFGGHDDQALGNRNDTWVFDPAAGSWSSVSVGDTFNEPITEFCAPPYDFAIVDPSLPERRSNHTFVWSALCGHALLFAGKTDCGATDDLWAFDGTRWQPLLAATEGEVCWRATKNPDNCLGLCL